MAFVTVSTAPAVVAGVVLMLWLTRTTLNIQSFMGAIMAIGVAMANGILLVTFAENQRRNLLSRDRIGSARAQRASIAAAVEAGFPTIAPHFNDIRRHDRRHAADGPRHWAKAGSRRRHWVEQSSAAWRWRRWHTCSCCPACLHWFNQERKPRRHRSIRTIRKAVFLIETNRNSTESQPGETP